MSPERQSLLFVLCVEAGQLEEQALLLVRSIRRWAGAYAEHPILAVRPRRGPKLRDETYASLRELGVTVHEEVLNEKHHDYVHANTIYSLIWAEHHRNEEIIVWCDSDTVFLSEPDAFDLPPGIDAAVTGPYYESPRGPKSTGPGHPFDPFWLGMYELAGVTEEPFVMALMDGQRVRAFWNGGLIVFRRRRGLAAEWLAFLELMLDGGHVPEEGRLNLDELTLSAILARDPGAVRELDHRYNHNLALRARLPEPQRSYRLADLVSVHYHIWFNRLGFLEDLRPRLDPSEERYRWLDEVLPMTPTNTRALPGEPRRKQRGPRRWRRLRRRIRRAAR